MWRRAIKPRRESAGRRTLVQMLFVAGLLVVALLGRSVEACPGSKQADAQSVIAAYKAERIPPAPILIVSEAIDQSAAKSNQSGSCCGAGCQTHSAACGGACCPGGFAANGPSSASLFCPAESVVLPPFDQAEIVSAQLPPDLRPPRTFI